jgi:spore maturation protein CgeB
MPAGSARKKLLSQVSERLDIFVGKAYLHDVVMIYSKSKIVLNESNRGDLNMRVFEGMSCGSLVLTDRIANGQEELFTDGQHLAVYDNVEDLFQKIHFYIADDVQRTLIAQRGQEEVHSKNTYDARARFMLGVTQLS